MSNFHTERVISVHHWTDKLFSFRTTRSPALRFRSGQFVMMGLETEGRPRTTYKPGDSFYVDAGKIHQGINTGSTPVKIVATLVAEKGKPLSTPAP